MGTITKLDEIKAALAQQEKIAQKNLEAQRRQAKVPAMNAFQQKQITADEYQAATGETYAETCKDMFDAEVENSRERVATRVKNGFLTAEQYEEITSVPYTEA